MIRFARPLLLIAAWSFSARWLPWRRAMRAIIAPATASGSRHQR